MPAFAITPSTGANDNVGSLNYALGNIGQSFQVDAASGRVTLPFGNTADIYLYLYPYVEVAFADDNLGNGISRDPTNKLYYGVKNISSINEGLVNHDFLWYANDFGTSITLYYRVSAPGKIQFIADLITSPPQGWFSVTDAPYNTIYVQDWVASTFASYVYVLELPDATIPAVGVLYPPLTSPNYLQPFVNSFYDVLVRDLPYNYVTSSTTATNVLNVPNLTSAALVTLTPQSSAPGLYSTGSMAMADAVNWDPAGYSTTVPYLAYYNGIAWVALG